jgi:hypothetical protein
MVVSMPQNVPHGIDGACTDWRDSPVETESMMTTGSGNPPTLGGDVRLTEFGLHFDGENDWATLRTTDYGTDATWTYSLWFSKAECNPNAAYNWEYMIAHSASEVSQVNLDGHGAPGGDDNFHAYIGCRYGEEANGWNFRNFTTGVTGGPGNMLRTVMQDSAGSFTLADLALSATLEEVMMGSWNHLAFSMSPGGFVYTIDGEVIPDTDYGIFTHQNFWDGNNARPRPSQANVPWAPFLGFGSVPLYLGARAGSEERREWFGYLANFVIYSEALDGICTAAIYEGTAGMMNIDPPPATIRSLAPAPPPAPSVTGTGSCVINNWQPISTGLGADFTVAAPASKTGRDIRSGNPGDVTEVRLPDIASPQPIASLRFNYQYVVGYGRYGADVPANVAGPSFTVSVVDAATGAASIVYTSPELSTYDYDTCAQNGGWGDDGVDDDGCYAPATSIDVPVDLRTAEFYILFTFTNNDRNMHLNEDGMNMAFGMCGGGECNWQPVPTGLGDDFSVAAPASKTGRDIRSGNPHEVNTARLPDITTAVPPQRLSFTYEYVVGYGRYGRDVPDNVLGPTFSVGLVDAATGAETVVYTSPVLSTYDYDTCGQNGGWGDDSIVGDGCYSAPVDVDVAVAGFTGTEFYVQFTFTNNDRNMHLNEDGLNMLVAACDGVGAAALGDAPVVAGLADGAVRLSSYPQGRIEVFRDGSWGTVCGHWFWDSDDGADIVCKQLVDANGDHPYAGGSVYTFGESADSTLMPIHTGCTTCRSDDSNILTCAITGAPGNDSPPDVAGCLRDSCRHAQDQGALCFASTSYMAWGSLAATVRPCDDTSLIDDTNMALFFQCVQYATVSCSFDVSSGSGSYDDALAAFSTCERQTQPAGYCSGSISSAEFLSNQHVCDGGSSTTIGFHIRIPFQCHFAGTYHFRMHADYGMGSFIGIDGAEHTPGNIWGHLSANDVNLREGDHDFEALGFEDCCDGHAELEVHFPCDRPDSVWRTIQSGAAGLTCLAIARCPAPAECGPGAGSAGCCGQTGSQAACGGCPPTPPPPSCDISAQQIEVDTSVDTGLISLGGHATLTEWGLHFDGVEDFATVDTPDYGTDATWTYSLWFSKAECNPNAATWWEYMIAHSAAEDSGLKLTGRGTTDSDDNVHVYLGCRPMTDLQPDSFWRFKSFVDPDNFGPPSNFIRIIMMDSTGAWTLADLPLSATLEEYMMGSWNHFVLSMSPTGWFVTLDGEVIPDQDYGVFGHHNCERVL